MNESTESIFEIVTGFRSRGEILRSMVVGHATLYPESDHYFVRLMIFPGMTYYLSKNRSSNDSYTLFAKKTFINGEVRLQNPVGTGRMLGDVKTHLEMRIPLLNLSLFMSLFPKN